MCVGFWSLEHPDYALILCTNRDEFLNRPTKDAHFHSFGRDLNNDAEEGRVLSGRDVRAGGTWLGITRTGRIALLTNITELPAENTSSRGHLVSSFLLSDSPHPLEDEVGTIIPRDTQFSGFNMLLLAPSLQSSSSLSFDASFVTNGGARGIITSRALSESERRCGGISNGVDGKGANEWPKVQYGTSQLSSLLGTVPWDLKEPELLDRLFEILAWRPPGTPSQLRDTIQVEPIPIKPKNLTDSDRGYGTRLSTVLLVQRDRRVLFVERDIWKLNEANEVFRADPQSQRVCRFTIEPRIPTMHVF